MIAVADSRSESIKAATPEIGKNILFHCLGRSLGRKIRGSASTTLLGGFVEPRGRSQ